MNADVWDQGADGWNANAQFIHTWLQPITAGMLDAARIRTGGRVLDIAAGAGDQTLDIARRVGSEGRVLATDVSPRFLAFARERVRAAGLSQVQTRLADAQALGLANAGFDAAVCRLGLMYCADPLAALQQVRAALRPGGRFSAVVFGTPQANPCVSVSMMVAREHTGLPPVPEQALVQPATLFSLSTPGHLHSLLVQAGFIEVDVQAVAAPHVLPDVTAYIDFVRTGATPIISLIKSLDAAAQTRVWIDLAARLQVYQTPGGWIGPNGLLLTSATAPMG